MPTKTFCRGTCERKPMNSEISQSKTICILAIVAGCFAVLMPSLFYPMLKGAFAPSIAHTGTVPQERTPVHLRATQGGIHPALLERGRAIPQSRSSSFPTPQSFKPPMPGIKPPMVGMGTNHKLGEGGGSMNILMPIYTIGIFLFFVYTIMKLLTKKNEDEPNDIYQNKYSHQQYSTVSNGKDHASAKQQPPLTGHPKLGFVEKDAIVNAFSSLLQDVNRELISSLVETESIPTINEYEELESLNANGVPCAIKLVDCESNDDEVTSTTDSMVIDKSTEEELGGDDRQAEEITDSEVYGKKVIQVVNMETSEGVDGGRCWTPKEKEDIRSSDDTSLSVPVSLFIPGPIPKNSQVLVSDGPHNTPGETEDHESVVSSKVTLSLIPDDRVHENGINEDEEKKKGEDEEEEEEEDDYDNDDDDDDDGDGDGDGDGDDDDERGENDDEEEDDTKTNTPTRVN